MLLPSRGEGEGEGGREGEGGGRGVCFSGMFSVQLSAVGQASKCKGFSYRGRWLSLQSLMECNHSLLVSVSAVSVSLWQQSKFTTKCTVPFVN